MNLFRAKPLTGTRIGLALAIAAIADGLQFAATVVAGPLGWAFFVQAIDVVAMILTIGTLGFHPLLLPTFVVELIPFVDMLPTWTACVGAVILLRKRSQSAAPSVVPMDGKAEFKKPNPPEKPVIEV